MDEPREELTPDELEDANGEPLPDREVMSILTGPEPYPMPYPVFPDDDPKLSPEPGPGDEHHLPVEPPTAS